MRARRMGTSATSCLRGTICNFAHYRPTGRIFRLLSTFQNTEKSSNKSRKRSPSARRALRPSPGHGSSPSPSPRKRSPSRILWARKFQYRDRQSSKLRDALGRMREETCDFMGEIELIEITSGDDMVWIKIRSFPMLLVLVALVPPARTVPILRPISRLLLVLLIPLLLPVFLLLLDVLLLMTILSRFVPFRPFPSFRFISAF